MSRETAEQLLEKRKNVIGEQLGSLYDSLYNEIVWLHVKWKEFNELFGTKPSRIAIMNKTAPHFFFVVQKVLWNDVLLSIAKITDNPTTGGKNRRNVTIKSLHDLINNDQEFKGHVKELVESIMGDISFCRDWRNRVIAHKDYSLAIEKDSAMPLEAANRKKVSDALIKFHKLLNLFEHKYFKSTLMLDRFSALGGATSLLIRLKDGLKYDEELYKRKLSGTATEADYRHEEI